MQTRPTPRKTRRRPPRRRLVFLSVAIWLGGAAWLWPDVPARLLHPARFATTPGARLPAQAYAAAAQARRPGDRIVALALPAGDGPVIVTMARARLWLDPPSARVLDVALADDGATALAHPAQPPGAVVARAAAVAPGRVTRIEWPGPGRPDWLVTLATGPRETVLKVADDTDRAGAAVARTVPRPGVTPGAVVRWGWLLLPGIAVVVMRRGRGSHS